MLDYRAHSEIPPIALSRCTSRSSGKERDTETGLDYFGARYYGASMVRFITPDWSAAPVPIPFSQVAAPQSLNLYSYVQNNPISKNDPDGHMLYTAALQSLESEHKGPGLGGMFEMDGYQDLSQLSTPQKAISSANSNHTVAISELAAPRMNYAELFSGPRPQMDPCNPAVYGELNELRNTAGANGIDRQWEAGAVMLQRGNFYNFGRTQQWPATKGSLRTVPGWDAIHVHNVKGSVVSPTDRGTAKYSGVRFDRFYVGLPANGSVPPRLVQVLPSGAEIEIRVGEWWNPCD